MRKADWHSGNIELYRGDCMEIMPQLADSSIDLIATDPPYFKVKNEAWDRQWDNPTAFIEWIGENCKEWARILKANGSLYCFASPKMAARVEVKISELLCILNRLHWRKEYLWHGKQGKHTPAQCSPESLRTFYNASEYIIFAEHYGADNMAKGEAGYAAKCDELRGFVFEPLRAYLDGERKRAGWKTEAIGLEWMKWQGRKSKWITRLAGHWFERVQWALPTEENYKWLRSLFNTNGPEYLRREYEYLRREYEELRREYEELRRPFSVTAQDQYTDVWNFPTVGAYKGKHPCEKPLEMMTHIVKTSTRNVDAIVLDPFMGSGTTLRAAKDLGRKAIGIEIEEKYCEIAARRLEQGVLNLGI